MTSEEKKIQRKGLGKGALFVILSVLAVGGTVLGILGGLGKSWALDALGGWVIGGVLGLTGFWTYQKALSGSDHNRLMKYVVGGMLLRMLLCGLSAGVVLGTGWLGTDGFVVGLLAGIAVFLGIEIGALQMWARRLGVAQPATNAAQSKTELEGVRSGS